MSTRPDPSSSHPARTTGRYLVLLEEDAIAAAAQQLKQTAGLSVASTSTAKDGLLSAEQACAADAVIYDQLGVAVVAAAPDQAERLRSAADDETALALVERERVVHALDAGGLPADWAPPVDESRITWGLVLLGAVTSSFTGAGVRLAVLDTGVDQNHPDFAGREIVALSFVAGEDVQDGHGGGTHAIGTAGGPSAPGELPRYGVACDAELYAGKVLNDTGGGTDESILAGIQWAMRNRCRVISMSLGAPTTPGQPYSRVFQQVARRARRRGTAIVAAAGDDSRREDGVVNPVWHPANCPSIMAVAAIDSQFQVAPSSNQGQERGGGQVDFAGPGVDVHSSWPMPTRYRRLSGTSTATPHVAGVAALLAEAEPGASAGELMALIAETALRLSLAPVDVGAGLVQAP